MEISRTNITFRQPPAMVAVSFLQFLGQFHATADAKNTKNTTQSIAIPGPWFKLRPRPGRDQAPNANRGPGSPDVLVPPLLPSPAGESVRVRTGGPTYPGRGRHRHGPQSFTRFLFIASRLEGASVAGEASDVFRRWNRKFCQSFCRGEGFLMGKRGRGRTRCATVRGRVRVSEEREATMS